jgi:hypothetical protein
MPAILHIWNKRGTTYRKFAFVNASRLRASQMTSILRELFEDDASNFPITRIDFAVDLIGIPISWFRERLIASRKRFSSEYGRSTSGEFIQFQTLYLGKRPNCIRIYDKIAQTQGSANSAAGLECVTRVERQCGNSGVPRSLTTFGKLKNATDFNPFAPLRTLSLLGRSGPETCGNITTMLARIGFETLSSRLGAQATTQFMNAHSAGNAARIRKRLGVHDVAACERLPDLLRIFREMVRRQLEVDDLE